MISFEFREVNMAVICTRCEEFPVEWVVTENKKRQGLCDRCYNEVFELSEIDEDMIDE